MDPIALECSLPWISPPVIILFTESGNGCKGGFWLTLDLFFCYFFDCFPLFFFVQNLFR